MQIKEPVFKNLKNNSFLEVYDHKAGKFNRSRKLGEEYLGWEISKIQRFPTNMPPLRDKEHYGNFEKIIKTLIESPTMEKYRDELTEKLLESPKGQELLNRKIEEIKGEYEDIEVPFICDMSREISDDLAEIEIKDFITRLKSKGIKEFNLLDVSLKTNLPFDQIDRILERLQKKGRNDN